MTPDEIIVEVRRMGGELAIVDDRLRVRPPGILPPELKRAAQKHAAELKALLTTCDLADEALAVLKRLKCYTLPAGRMSAAREIAERSTALLVQWEDGEPIGRADDPGSILAVLRQIERELIALGAVPDPELANAVALVTAAFPGAWLIELRKLQ